MRAPTTRRDSAVAVVSRRTSGRRTWTAEMAAPETARSRSRAIVSVSGSSGTSLLLSPGDVAPELFAIELDLARDACAFAPGEGERGRDRRDCEHPSARSNQLSCRSFTSSSVKYEHVGLLAGQPDGCSPARLVWITGSRHYGGYCMRARPSEIVPSQAAPMRHREQWIQQAALQQRKDRLRLRISKTRVELHDLGPLGREHEPRVEQTA